MSDEMRCVDIQQESTQSSKRIKLEVPEVEDINNDASLFSLECQPLCIESPSTSSMSSSSSSKTSSNSAHAKILSSKNTVLLVDDSPTVLGMITRVLSNVGYTVETDNNGAQALEKMKSKIYGYVLVDINMPVMSGPTTVRKFRDFEVRANSFARQKIIAMSSDFTRHKLKEIISSGFDAFVVKPFTAQKFKAVTDLCDNATPWFQAGDDTTARQSSAPLPPNVTPYPPPRNRVFSHLTIGTLMPSLRVLVVDDSPSTLKFISKILSCDGHVVYTKQNGKEALECMVREKYDLVIMDIHMPEMGGLEASAEFRVNEINKTCQVDLGCNGDFDSGNCDRGDSIGVATAREKQRLIAMTSSNDPALVADIMAAGFDGLLLKPFSIQKFRGMWEAWSNVKL